MNYRNAKYNAFGSIDCEIEHPIHGWIPFTADPNDVEPLGAEVFNAAKDSASAYVAPPPPTSESIATQARTQRDALLSQSDWTQVADAPVDQSAWATYRRALRDVPRQAGFPANIVWPTRPEVT
jgi:hypothetical protein